MKNKVMPPILSAEHEKQSDATDTLGKSRKKTYLCREYQ
jgi:hypothetical protein